MLIGVIAEELLLAEAVRQTELFLDVDLFPSATLRVPGFLLLEGQFDSDDVIPNAFITTNARGIFPPPFNDNDVVYDFSKSLTGRALSPALVQDNDIFYSPPILTNVLGPSLVVDDDVFSGVQKIFQFIPLSGVVVDADIIFHSIIRRDGDAIVLLAETFNDAETFYAPAFSSALLPSRVVDTDVFYAPARLTYVVPSVVSDSDVFLTSSVAKQLRPSAVSDADVFVGPTVSTPGRLELVIDNDVVFAPAVRMAPLAPALFVDSDTFSVPVIGAPAIVPNDAVVDFSDTFFTPLIRATQVLLPVIWIDVDDYRSPDTIEAQPPLRPILLVDTDVIYAPTEVTGPAALLPGVGSDADTFFAPSIGSGTIPAPLDAVANVTGAWSLSRDMLTAFAGGTRYTKTGTAITALKDQSGNTRDFTDVGLAARRPTETTAFPASVLCADFFGTSTNTMPNVALSNFITASSGAVVVSVIVDAISSNVAVSYNNDGIIADGSIYMGLYARNLSGVTFYAYNWDGSEDAPSRTGAVGTAYVLMWRHHGGNIYISVNGGTEVSVASGNTQVLTGSLVLGGTGGGSACNCKVAELFTTSDGSQTAALAAAIANMKTYIGA